MSEEEKNLYLEQENEFEKRNGRKPFGCKELYPWLYKKRGFNLDKLVKVEEDRRITGKVASEEFVRTPKETIMASLPLNVFSRMIRSEKRIAGRKLPARRKQIPRRL